MKKVGLILLAISLLLFTSGIILHNVNSTSNKKVDGDSSESTNIKTDTNLNDPNYIDRSAEEQQIRNSTNNEYYTINTSKKLSLNRSYESLLVNNPKLVRISKEWYSFSCFLVNNSNSLYPASTFDIQFVDKDGKILFTEEGIVSAIEPGATGTLSLSTKNDILGSYDFNIVRKGDYTPIINDVREPNS